MTHALTHACVHDVDACNARVVHVLSKQHHCDHRAPPGPLYHALSYPNPYHTLDAAVPHHGNAVAP